MATIAERIDGYFIEMEWPFDQVDEHLWHTAFPGDLQVHEIFVSNDEDNWISFRSMVCRAPQASCVSTMHEHLLRLNSLIPMTKFCIMENGDVFALVDLPVSDMNFSEFRTALTTIVNHVDAYDNEILKICESPEHHSSLGKAGVAV